MDSKPNYNTNTSQSKKRQIHVLTQDLMGSFSDKASFYQYMKEQLLVFHFSI
jgi:hypothetical protein